MEEIWKKLIYNNIDYGNKYIISNYGKIKNLETGYVRNLALYKGCHYYQTNIIKDGYTQTIKIHRAVAQNFIPNPNNLPEVNHKDGNKLNNYVGNLEWVTKKENQIHAVIKQLSKSGENSDFSKLTQEQVDYIKNNCIPFDRKFGCKALAEKFGVHITTVSKIIHNSSWKTYTEEYRQTNYAVKEIHKQIIYNKICPICNGNYKTKKINQKFCSETCRELSKKQNSKKPEKEVLFQLIQEKSFLEIGRLFNVSDNAVRKWCKSYDLPYKKSEIVSDFS